jgi:hypothetical protein
MKGFRKGLGLTEISIGAFVPDASRGMAPLSELGEARTVDPVISRPVPMFGGPARWPTTWIETPVTPWG